MMMLTCTRDLDLDIQWIFEIPVYIKGMLQPTFCIDINTYSDRK